MHSKQSASQTQTWPVAQLPFLPLSEITPVSVSHETTRSNATTRNGPGKTQISEAFCTNLWKTEQRQPKHPSQEQSKE